MIFIKTEHGLHRVHRIIGYQCKAGANSSKSTIPNWTNKVILFQGKEKNHKMFPRHWKHANREEVKAFLGFSLAMLYDLYTYT
mmetsp:Transcript_20601/g.28484  ORF Transcript_20601/g.28484 Transcript_20601/m.28484 type:complete len:83 (+) Transcript_20601:877-1125(+)